MTRYEAITQIERLREQLDQVKEDRNTWRGVSFALAIICGSAFYQLYTYGGL
jgi:hypothetical protein